MTSTTLGVKVDEPLRNRIKEAAAQVGRTPHWLIKQAIYSLLDDIERGRMPSFLQHLAVEGGGTGEQDEPAQDPVLAEPLPQPFFDFAQTVAPQSVLRAAVTSAYRRPEPQCLPMLIGLARSADPASVSTLATRLVKALREKRSGGGVDGLIQEFSLSSQEGVALMCLAEALLRIPDRATRDALIRDKISGGDWQSHLRTSPSMFVNAATWGLMITGRLVSTNSERGLASAVTRLIGKGGEPLIRKGVDMAMRLMGEHFVSGETISEALANSRKWEARNFRYSYDMLGEAATTAKDAERYYAAYEQAIHAIGKASAGRGIYAGPGISIKLSALHPRYSRAQQERVMDELLPRLRALTLLARRYDIGLNIDAEEADRLEISLDLLEALCEDPALAGWNGVGFVIQAYQKRAPYVIDYVTDLARRTRRRLMIRLVKGAYWDSEIKRAQVEGLEGYPVYTRKVYTDVSYLACARKLLDAPEAVYPQFATHNAHTLAAIHAMAGQNYYPGQYEFQCLHGMGEPLYEEVTKPVEEGGLARPCRIYAPVGTHETLLAYLVRRLLENGANTSFVNRIADPDVSLDDLVRDPVEEAQGISPLGAPHPRIPSPGDLYRAQGGGERQNALGLDLSNEQRLASLSAALLASSTVAWRAAPAGAAEDASALAVTNPADRRDVVGHVVSARPEDVDAALERAVHAAQIWQATPAEERAACLRRAADLLEGRMQPLLGLIVREAGKSFSNAIAEVREAVDFLRYYALQVETGLANDTHRPLGPVVCISPWNFPLAIFLGQVSAALAAGNPVLAKPAEQTALIAAQGVRLLHEAGVPEAVVQLLPGTGETVGAALTADPRVRAVMFTGSTAVARHIARALAGRLDAQGQPIPLIAETGGQNAMVVDSSALAEQVVMDVVQSSFDSAGQRCSALRILCLQDDVADRVLGMLKGAMRQLTVGNPDRLSTDVGPVIDAEARDGIERHIEAMRARGFAVDQLALPAGCANGTFVPPTLIEIEAVADVEREVFGPVLHVVRYPRAQLDRLMEDINATGYGLTFGVHSRIDETIDRLVTRAKVGNVYVNRNVIGAIVGVQPFGGERLSGTGPKAGGPLYLPRLLATAPVGRPAGLEPESALLAPLDALAEWLEGEGDTSAATLCRQWRQDSAVGAATLLPGPTGERNTYRLEPRGPVLCVARSPHGARVQLATALAAGNPAWFVQTGNDAGPALAGALPQALAAWVRVVPEVALDAGDALGGVLFEGDGDGLIALSERLAERDGPIVQAQGRTVAELAQGRAYRLERLLAERSVSVNTAAAGGNASLMTIG
ncbi:trifunctional transcriptional regulator/proline dehydrogenase/L-glutamate gamma-semialdehyde dehydrogenase [Achromobacter sp. GG226]|uniref:trifunctional transcriptional regulator/proline dehydrogenase/L-glutamate gamma-semialdehyde dehydrogenase n=1 Tax=Verticiella alkaliphila TaxID=2779529 RepID=UPI001C0AABB0|nr:trifunctional transcriptional regulator/proline dehydrogenase/L-glutamate gamma-semialdehyde dehydrogenase [Verticiella sp. GG226]MBU4612562.1 trifunctional transcriptional regulator/proline dehydrogenase/L-glutamate gamma-semialdehyde dehydrogenase [Verticiella sp. GG226]